MTPEQKLLADKLTNLQAIEQKILGAKEAKGETPGYRFAIEKVRSAIKYAKEELDGANT